MPEVEAALLYYKSAKKQELLNLCKFSLIKTANPTLTSEYYNGKQVIMKLSFGTIALTWLVSLTASDAAEESLYVVIRTLIRVEETLSASEQHAIDTAMHSIKPELDNAVKEVIANATSPSTRKLRVDRKLPCSNACRYYPPNWTMCYVNGVWIDRCRRELTMHEDLSEEEVADLNEEDRRRHLEIAALCEEAKTAVAAVIEDAESEGIIPVPPDREIAEQCFYEYA
jgi:hypothetical protein